MTKTETQKEDAAKNGNEFMQGKDAKDDAKGAAERKDVKNSPGQKAEPPSSQHEKNDDTEKKLAETNERLLRLAAEFDNYKKRTAKEKEQISAHSEAKFMLRLLSIYEEIALAEKECAKVKDAAVKHGALLVLEKLRRAFESEGLSEMKLEGAKFDPFLHESALREESEMPEGQIVRVIQKGYSFRGEVLRHAIVSVSAGKKQEKKEDVVDEKAEKKTEN